MATKESPSLEIRRVIKAPRDRVYAAWTDPAQLKQWFGPENVQTRDLIADARVGAEGWTDASQSIRDVGEGRPQPLRGLGKWFRILLRRVTG